MFSSNTTQVSSGGSYQISRSLRFNSADSAYLGRTPGSASNRTTWTWSAWVKRGDLSAATRGLFGAGSASSTDTGIYWTSGDKIDFFDRSGGSLIGYVTTNAVFRDPSAWYHIVVVFDSGNATAANRMLIYINNVSQSLTVNNTLPQNTQSAVNNTVGHNLGSLASASNYGNGYMTEVNFIDGQALTPSSFGQTNANTGVWEPKPYAGTYGTNGFYLNFSDNSNTTATTLGKDYSGNGNNWTPNNFSVSAGAGNDSLVDVPTAWGTDTGVGGTVRGNYATLNPLNKGTNATITNGNLDYTSNSSIRDTRVYSSIGMSSGKWYCEYVPTAGATNLPVVGIALSTESPNSAGYVGFTSGSYGYYANNGAKLNNDVSTAYGSSYGLNDIIGIAFDADAGTLTYYKNGVTQGVAFTGIPAGTYFFAEGDYTGSYSATFNFGQRPFAYTAPSGFKALCTQNLPTPTVGATAATQAGKFFNAVIYTPTSYPAVTTGVGFQPDFTWWKNRVRGEGHGLFDVLRGSNLFLRSNTTAADDTQTNGWVANSDGWTSSSGSYTLNESYVAWNWKANGAGVTNTAGSITSTVSANTTSGFSVVTWTCPAGASDAYTVGHGLGAAPKMIIIKSRNGAYNWFTWHIGLGDNTTDYITLNGTGAEASSAGMWGAVGRNSAVMGFTNGVSTIANNTMVAYVFSEVPGFSKFGSYTGNNSTDGPFVYCGFRPAWLLVKRTGNVAGWFVVDNKRNTYNLVNNYLYANTSDAEQQYPIVDFLSNGFKVRMADTSMNAPGETYVFAAFAEFPQKFSLAR